MDQFQEVRPGQRLPGLPTQAWNQMLRRLKARPAAPARPVGGSSPVEVLVKNTSGSPLASRFGILQVNSPRVVYSAANAQAFFDEDTLLGVTPAVAAPFVVVQEPLSADGFGIARLLGLTRCSLDVVHADHTHAYPTTDPAKLKTGPAGPARIVWKETGTGTKWGVVMLTGAAPPGKIRFTLPSALATTDASKASCTVDSVITGGSPGSTVTVYNMPASSDYVFSGASGNKGKAEWDEANQRFEIYQLECP